jgi:hypothetical protein
LHDSAANVEYWLYAINLLVNPSNWNYWIWTEQLNWFALLFIGSISKNEDMRIEYNITSFLSFQTSKKEVIEFPNWAFTKYSVCKLSFYEIPSLQTGSLEILKRDLLLLKRKNRRRRWTELIKKISF